MTNTTDEWLWTDWAGGKSCPVTDGTIFKVKFRSENISHGDNFRDPCFWSETGGRSDIIAYTVRNPNYVAPAPIDHLSLLRQCGEALGDSPCPYMIDGNETARDCHAAGQCGCSSGATLEALRKAGVM